ncbi:MAG TPA: hypothetical protein VIH57_09440 [Bacteroidales bacterium]
MKTSINRETIRKMINDSTWINNENSTLFTFSNDKDCSLNGKNHLYYSLSNVDSRIVIQIGADKSYYVDYINDFSLCFYNDNERFRITLE